MKVSIKFYECPIILKYQNIGWKWKTGILIQKTEKIQHNTTYDASASEALPPKWEVKYI